MSETSAASKYDERAAAQTAALARLGFGAAVGFGGLFGPSGAPCLTCAALVMFGDTEATIAEPLHRHRDWHAAPSPEPVSDEAGAVDAAGGAL